MNRMIGFDRELHLDWLDATVAQCQRDRDPKRVQRNLDLLLEGEINGDKARRNTLTVLMRIWLKVPSDQVAVRDEGLILATHVAPAERLWLHWGMSLLAYPFFRDIASIVGQLGSLQGTFGQAQVQRRMVESWGQRTTLIRAAQRVLRTFVEWQVLAETEARGQYAMALSRQTENVELALWLFDCALRAHDAEQVPLSELDRLPYTFPFRLTPFLDDIRVSHRFDISRQGLDLEMIASYPELH